MAQEVLDVQLPSAGPDRPGREGVTEAVGVDVADAGLKAVAREDDVQMVIAKRPALDTRTETY